MPTGQGLNVYSIELRSNHRSSMNPDTLDIPSFAKLIEAAWKKIKRPRISELRAPVNLFVHAQPYVTLEHCRDIFGSPYRVDGCWITFRFNDIYLQVTSKDGITAMSVDVLLRRHRAFTTFPVYPLKFVLGRLKLSDVLDGNNHLQREYSSKFYCIFTNRYFGNPGNYHHYLFGVYSGSGIRGPKFTWDNINCRLQSDPARIPINWIKISSSATDFGTPNFHHFI